MNIDNLRGSDNEVKPRLNPGSNVCYCPSCEEWFTGVKAFDAHLGGSGTAEPWCLTAEEMEAVGLERNTYGVWKGQRIAQESYHRVRTRTAIPA